MSTKSQPSRCVSRLKNKAKKLKKYIQTAEHENLLHEAKRFQILPKYSNMSPEDIVKYSPSLTECQHTIAKEYLFDSWPNLIKELPHDEKTIKSILKQHERLTYYGLFQHSIKKRGLDYQKERDELLNDYAIKEFRYCVKWLSLCKKIKTPNIKIGSSYTLKHRVEGWTQKTSIRKYISNGSFITAVFYLGIPYKYYWDSPNIHIALSSKCSFLKSTPPIH